MVLARGQKCNNQREERKWDINQGTPFDERKQTKMRLEMNAENPQKEIRGRFTGSQ